MLSESRGSLLIGCLNNFHVGGKRNGTRLELSLVMKEKLLVSAGRNKIFIHLEGSHNILVFIMLHYVRERPRLMLTLYGVVYVQQEPPGCSW